MLLTKDTDQEQQDQLGAVGHWERRPARKQSGVWLCFLLVATLMTCPSCKSLQGLLE